MCKQCSNSFSISYKRKPVLWVQYIDGTPMRKLADQHKISPAKIHDRLLGEMDKLPENTWVSERYCQRWSGRLNVDGKYVAIKGCNKKIPFIYGIDFLTHDIPVGMLAPSENELSFTKFFRLLKACRYPLQIVICDDAAAIRPALARYFPNARIQLCHVHYLENIRQRLQVRTLPKYQTFFSHLAHAFRREHHPAKRDAMLRGLFESWGKRDFTLKLLMIEIMSRQGELFAYNFKMDHCPHTNNLIESFNSHMQARLKSIKGFQSFHSAERWLNAWMLRRRTKPFTDCGVPFKHLNGKMSLEVTLRKNVNFPLIPGIQAPNTER